MTPRVLVVQHEEDGPPGHVGGWLLEAGCVLDVRSPYAGEPPAATDLDGVRRPAGARRRDGRRRRRPPLVADADEGAWSGPRPTPSCRRWASASATSWRPPRSAGCRSATRSGQQIGVLDVGWTAAAAEDPLLATVSATPRRGLQWNYDVVDPLPGGTTVLAATADGEVQAARFGPAMWGVQCHPEVDATIVGAWVTDDERTDLADRGLDADGFLADIDDGPGGAGRGLAAVHRRSPGWSVERRAREPADHRPGQPDPARFPRPDRGRTESRRRSGTRPSRWSPCWPGPPTPTQALAQLRPADRGGRRTRRRW